MGYCEMGLVAAIFWIIAGIGYLGKQYNEENPGAIGAIAILCAIVCTVVRIIDGAATWAGELKYNGHPVASFVIMALLFIGIVVLTILWIVLPRKAWSKDIDDSAKIWEEVMALPEPDIDTLLRYRDKLGLPRVPRKDITMNRAALDAWRKEQYNIRYKERHNVL